MTDTARDRAAAISSYEQHKRVHNNTESDCEAQGIKFIPIVAEAAGGGWGPSAEQVFSELAKVKTLVSGELRNSVLTHLYQTLGLTLHRENARAILRRSTIASIDYTALAVAATVQSPP